MPPARACSKYTSTRPRNGPGSCSRPRARRTPPVTDRDLSRSCPRKQASRHIKNWVPAVAGTSEGYDRSMNPSRDIARLIEIMAALRTPGSGCPWDLEQTFETIAPYTIEEAYEVADAIARDDLDDLKDELGDLLLQVVFHARMAEEQGSFAFGDVVQAITDKLIRRHPHVFTDKGGMSTPEVNVQWDQIKAEEKAARAKAGKSPA